ncbi:MAG: alpha-L-fucosidase [Cyclobacteriaceae bacterium]|nr:alpha-L-fucosidase [Cyclobacteriaceae bacterium]
MGIDRRKFLKQAGVSGAGLITLPQLHTFDPFSLFPSFNANQEPSILQREWMEMGFGMFIHFGINTYYDKEWSDGNFDPYRINPTALNTDEWCRVAQAAGMKYIVIVSKHHDGFCLWPSRFTDYTISRSKFNRDILAAISNSASKFGLKLGLYYSLWDQHESESTMDEWKYIDFIKNQVTELLIDYGPIVEIWFDGFWQRQQSGWEKKPEGEKSQEITIEELAVRNENFIDAWRMEGAYRWQMDHLYNFVKSLQPACFVMNNSTGSYPGVPLFPVDARTGERYVNFKEDRKKWNWLGQDVYVPLQIETTMSTKGNQQFPEGNWFWHEWDHSVLSKEEVNTYLDFARKHNANLLLNVGPGPDGRLRKEDETVLSGLNG